ncbi:MAG: hypothetical protein WKF36_10440 [Candidatus Nitrosocosmicus sp.]
MTDNSSVALTATGCINLDSTATSSGISIIKTITFIHRCYDLSQQPIGLICILKEYYNR